MVANSPSCVLSAGEIYCVGGYSGPVVSNAVKSASYSSSGIGNWTSLTSYPASTWGEPCVASVADIYCVGGGTVSNGILSAVYFAKIGT